MKIEKIVAREILDSRGNPTVEVEMFSGDLVARSAVPSGASTGSKEALELRDGDAKRFGGKGVLKVCQNIEEKIFPALETEDFDSVKALDEFLLKLDGTENKSTLGANAILAVSMAFCRLLSQKEKISLWQFLQKEFAFSSENKLVPIPMMNVINGGVHSDSGLDIQEFMLVPSGISSFSERIRAGAEIYHQLAGVLISSGYKTAVGDEGGYAPAFSSNEEALRLITVAIEKAGYVLGKEIFLGLDAAASEFFNKDDQKYFLKLDNFSADGKALAAMYRDWKEKYHLELIEDPFSEFDWENWSEFNQEDGKNLTIIGDDLLVTKKSLIEEAFERKACNAVLIKVNQIGTISQTVDAIMAAKKQKMKIAVSHRSGETPDDFIADLAVAFEADYVKFGAPCRGERVAKYNRLMEISARNS